ncbi:MAG: glycerol-3-phosphate 1-O-acyltransferase PlsY [Betaproteobacteria bacterium]|nr:glycerol-3-phosphate 1-O-acyltransferase PlsY [Betaproteobacteria bacterium]
MNMILFAMGAYLIGSVSFAIVVSKLLRLEDPRTYGSQNPGATNVLRTGNKLAAVLTLVGDCAKGWFAVVLAIYFSTPLELGIAGVSLAAFAVFAGHVWPVFFGFKGGKGVATALGVLLALSPPVGVTTLCTWIIIAYTYRYSSLAALVAAVFAPIYQLLLFGPGVKLVAIFLMSVILIYRHRGNIANLRAGTETRLARLSEKKPQEASAVEQAKDG